MRSLVIFSGITITSLYPLAAHIAAKPMPVFPEVAATKTVFLLILVKGTFSSMCLAILSLTENAGL